MEKKYLYEIMEIMEIMKLPSKYDMTHWIQICQVCIIGIDRYKRISKNRVYAQ